MIPKQKREKEMKIVAFIGIGLALNACTIERTIVSEPTDPPATTEAIQSPPPAPIQNRNQVERDFVEAVRDIHVGPVYVSDQELIDTGWVTCEGFEYGGTIEDAVAMAVDVASSDDSLNLLFEVIAGAVAFLCPEFSYLIDDMEGSL